MPDCSGEYIYLKKTFGPLFQKYTHEELAVTHLALVARKPKR